MGRADSRENVSFCEGEKGKRGEGGEGEKGKRREGEKGRRGEGGDLRAEDEEWGRLKG